HVGRQRGNGRFGGSTGAAIAGAAEEAHRCCGETFDGAAAVSATGYQDVRHELRFAFSKSGDNVDDGRGVRTERFDLRAITPGACQTDGFDFGAFRRTGLADVFGFAGGFGNASVGVVLLDVHAYFGAGEVGLHVRSAFGLLHFDALILSGALLFERFDFL